eukprot:1193625-Prorocentrum_minimum.AAC.4
MERATFTKQKQTKPPIPFDMWLRTPDFMERIQFNHMPWENEGTKENWIDEMSLSELDPRENCHEMRATYCTHPQIIAQALYFVHTRSPSSATAGYAIVVHIREDDRTGAHACKHHQHKRNAHH